MAEPGNERAAAAATELLDLRGRRAIVTGGASGIGRATTELLCRLGARVVIADTDVVRGEEAAGAIDGADFVVTDVSDGDSVAGLVRAAVERMGGVDALINVAGVQVTGVVTEFAESDWDRTMAVNVRGCFLTAQHTIPHLRAASDAVVVNVASISAWKGLSGATAYCASKGAVVSFTRALAAELAPFGIRANSVCPGWIDTPFNDAYADTLGGHDKLDELVGSTVPLGRQAVPEEAARMIVLLVSGVASYVTGQSLVVDGGLLA